MSRRLLSLVVFALLVAAPAALAQDTGSGPGGLPACGQGQLPTPQSPCALPPCAQGQLPTPQSPCAPTGVQLPGGTGGQLPGNLQPCADGQQPTPQAPCLPAGGFPTGPQVVCPGGGAGGDAGGAGSRQTGGPCSGAGAGAGGGQGSGLPALSGGFLNHVWKMNADADSYDAANNVLDCTVTKFLSLPKKFAKMDDDLIDTDAFVLFSPTTRVYGVDGKRVPKEVKYDTLLDNAETVKIEGKVVPPKSWQKDTDGTPTPTFRAKKVYILS